MTSSYREIYDRHRGPYSLHLVRELTNEKGKVSRDDDHLAGPFSAEEAHEESRTLIKAKDPKGIVTEVFVFSVTEGQFIGAFYKRGEEHRPWHEEQDYERTGAAPGRGDLPGGPEGGLELSAERDAPALLPRRKKPVRKVDDPEQPGVPEGALPGPGPVRDVPAEEPARPRAKREPSKLPGDRFPVVRGRPLELDGGNAERWPRSEGAQLVRAFLGDGHRATTAEIVAALGPKLRELGVGFPASLVSRLKQGGFLKEVSE